MTTRAIARSSAPARPGTGDAAAATTWRASSTTAASTTTCRKTRASTWHSSSGGAEGTLATITELKLKLVPRPRRLTVLAIVEFPSLLAALEATPAILETSPTAVELIDDLSLRMAAENRDAARLVKSFVKGSPFCFLVVEYQGETEAELRANLQSLISQSPNLPITPLYDPKLQANVWAVRKIGLGLLMSMRSDWKPIPFIEDTAVPPEHLAEYIPKIAAFCADLGTEMTYYAHASSGCLHIRPLLNLKQGAEIDKMRAISLFVADLLGDYGGALSSEHGDGRVRSWLAERFYGPGTLHAFQGVSRRRLTRTTSSTPATSSMRRRRIAICATAQPIRLRPARKPRCTGRPALPPKWRCATAPASAASWATGAMCPSFMATREEEHSTRGRANLLRAALSGRLPAAELTSPRLYAALELCVACKACKAECPSSVDMARLKTEFLAQYYTVHPRRKRDYLFAHIDALSRLASGWRAPLANWALGWASPSRSSTAGLASARSVPCHFQPVAVSAKSDCAGCRGEGERGRGGAKEKADHLRLHNSPMHQFTNLINLPMLAPPVRRHLHRLLLIRTWRTRRRSMCWRRWAATWRWRR